MVWPMGTSTKPELFDHAAEVEKLGPGLAQAQGAVPFRAVIQDQWSLGPGFRIVNHGRPAEQAMEGSPGLRTPADQVRFQVFVDRGVGPAQEGSFADDQVNVEQGVVAQKAFGVGFVDGPFQDGDQIAVFAAEVNEPLLGPDGDGARRSCLPTRRGGCG